MRSCLALLLTAFLCWSAAAQSQPVPQEAFAAYGPQLRDAFWEGVYAGGGETLYCGAGFSARRADLSIEHVMPASRMVERFGCGSRRACRRDSAAFNRMEADLHNLFPSLEHVNALRSDLRHGVVDGGDRPVPGCDFEVSRDAAEPRPAARGEIARAVLHMAAAYGVPLGRDERAMLADWDGGDPPDTAERRRNDRIAELQGTRNPYIDAHAHAAAAVAAARADGARVRLATWNIADLHGVTGEPLPDRSRAPARTEEDFARLRRYALALDADIVAFQEVNAPEAARRVFPADAYDVVVSDRWREDRAAGRATDGIYTGFAVRRGGPATLVEHETYRALGVDHVDARGVARPTRRGAEILVGLPGGRRLRLMSVHLKSGCHEGGLSPPGRPDCETLARQGEALEAWVDRRTREEVPFVVLGDFNRRFDRFGEADHLWAAIDDGDPPPLDLFRLPEGLVSPCYAGTDGHFPMPIDFLVFDEQAWAWVDPSSLRILDYAVEDRPHRARLSDHCPVVVDLVLPPEP